jgi:hypothetical protein
VKSAPGYPQNFTTTLGAMKATTTRNTASNKALLEQLRQIETGNWQKVYKDWWVGSEKVSLHYFQPILFTDRGDAISLSTPAGRLTPDTSMIDGAMEHRDGLIRLRALENR